MKDSTSGQAALHNQAASDQTCKPCLKSSPCLFFFFYVHIFTPTAAGKPDQLTGPKENKPSKSPEG